MRARLNKKLNSTINHIVINDGIGVVRKYEGDTEGYCLVIALSGGIGYSTVEYLDLKSIEEVVKAMKDNGIKKITSLSEDLDTLLPMLPIY